MVLSPAPASQGLQARGTQGFSLEKFTKVDHGNFQSRVLQRGSSGVAVPCIPGADGLRDPRQVPAG
ncbi:MAG: hypothetical protein C0477_18160, partial [Delftia sp.]|nr:hypothetical protein [Delftia sp.]